MSPSWCSELKDNRDEIRRILICRLASVPRAGAECRDPCVGIAVLLSFKGHQDANLLSIPRSAGLCTPAAHFHAAPNARTFSSIKAVLARLPCPGSHAQAPLTAHASSIPVEQALSRLSEGTRRSWREIERTSVCCSSLSSGLQCGLVVDVLPFPGRHSSLQSLLT